MSLDALYREVVLDHHRHPRGREPLERVDAHSHGVNPSCGDDVTVELALRGGLVTGVCVRGHGCAISTASGSILAELLDEGGTVEDARRLAAVLRALMRGEALPVGEDLGDLEALAGVRKFPVRIKCALLPWITLEQALDGGGRPTMSAITTPARVRQALSGVDDPELGFPITDLGLVRGVDVHSDGTRVIVYLTLTSPMCPMGPEILAAAHDAAVALDGVAEVDVQLVWQPPWDPREDASEDVKAELGIWL